MNEPDSGQDDCHDPPAVKAHPSPRTLAMALRLAAGQFALLTTTAALTAACTTPPAASTGPSGRPAPAPTRTASTSPVPSPRAEAVVATLTDAQWARMKSAGLWRKGCPEVRKQLRRLEINYWNFEGRVRRGALVVNADVADSIARILTHLFDERFPIRRMQPMEDFGGDLNKSLRADNTSAFNCRKPDQINAPYMESPHANGRAIDINPLENPWVDIRTKRWAPSRQNRARTPGKGKILEGDLVWRLFTAEGWVWQDIKVADYMHFDTGYPSVPFAGPSRASTAETKAAG